MSDNFNDIISAAVEKIHHDENTELTAAFNNYPGNLTVCTITYIHNGSIRTKIGTSKCRKGEVYDYTTAILIALVRAITSKSE